jgi:hypothetical protein
MECIYIICKSCNEIDKIIAITQNNAIPIEYDDEIIKNIIESNHITNIGVCGHYKYLLKQLLVKWDKNEERMYVCFDYNSSTVYNRSYKLHYGYFLISKCDEDALSFTINEGEVSTEEFLNTIKKGTIMRIYYRDIVIPKLEQLLADSGFVLKNITKITLNGAIVDFYIIDTPVFTKAALKIYS